MPPESVVADAAPVTALEPRPEVVLDEKVDDAAAELLRRYRERLEQVEAEQARELLSRYRDRLEQLKLAGADDLLSDYRERFETTQEAGDDTDGETGRAKPELAWALPSVRPKGALSEHRSSTSRIRASRKPPADELRQRSEESAGETPAEVNLVIRLVRSIAACMSSTPAAEPGEALIDVKNAQGSGVAE
jgi:hypothetical protein